MRADGTRVHRMTDLHGAARLHTKMVEEMLEARKESRKNAQAADKGKMTNEATLFSKPWRRAL